VQGQVTVGSRRCYASSTTVSAVQYSFSSVVITQYTEIVVSSKDILNKLSETLCIAVQGQVTVGSRRCYASSTTVSAVQYSFSSVVITQYTEIVVSSTKYTEVVMSSTKYTEVIVSSTKFSGVVWLSLVG
jgi:hypothetical protein